MPWKVCFNQRTSKQYRKLPMGIQAAVNTLLAEIESLGPTRGNWKNYSKLGLGKHHCHVKTGRPTYVVCWRIVDRSSHKVEVYYVGTHEKAPY